MASLLDPMITKSPISPSDGTALVTEEDSILNELDSRNNQARQIVTIITGVAGTGKSTILYHYYDKTKEIHADHWVIKINFKDMAPAFLLQLSKSSRHSLFFGRSDAIDFLVDNLPFVIGSSSFARSLLRHRLETGDRIVLMLDGFDEIDSQCQDIAIQLMKVLIEDGKQQQANSVRLFVTTRSHIVNDLQFQLSQLAYALENFNKKDQIDCLTSYWMKHNSKTATTGDAQQEVMEKIAESLVDQLSSALRDEERSFIGIPLQCRILAECFMQRVNMSITQLYNKNRNFKGTRVQQAASSSGIFDKDQKFDLASLYRMLMETKHQVFHVEKIKLKFKDDHIVNDSVNNMIRHIKIHLKKLTVETIFTNQSDVEIMWPPESLYESETDSRQEADALDKLSIRFGLVNQVNGKLKFLHRTYAEYLVAEYVYKRIPLRRRQTQRIAGR